MAQGKKSSKGGEKNAERRCGKASKKHSGNPPSRCNGKSKGGYSLKPELVEARALRKAQRAAKHGKKTVAA